MGTVLTCLRDKNAGQQLPMINCGGVATNVDLQLPITFADFTITLQHVSEQVMEQQPQKKKRKVKYV